MEFQHIALLILASVASAAIAYAVAKFIANRSIKEYRNLREALTNTKDLIELANGEVQQARDTYAQVDAETKELQELKSQAEELQHLLQETSELLDKTTEDLEMKENDLEQLEKKLHELMSKVDLYSRVDEFVEAGLYEVPDYLYETSERFAEEIRRVRENQKELISDKAALMCPEETTISGNAAHDKKILNGQLRLMLTAFNIECDLLIGKISPSNFARTLERIEKLAATLEKSAATLQFGFNIEYVKLKFEECRLQYQFKLKKQAEQEEQRLIREQIREEQKAIKEYERAVAQAEKEERMFRDLLEKARKELGMVSEAERTAAEQRIALLEAQLAEAEAKEQRAKSMAEQTRRGHVYVISNVGSFGDTVYKIGLTRRLEPLDRVKELGDASVPFPFDVHAMIYVEDAPALETALHHKFDHHRVNAVNRRKEFFRVELRRIKDAVAELTEGEAEFKMTALAEQYYESRRLQGRDVSAA